MEPIPHSLAEGRDKTPDALGASGTSFHGGALARIQRSMLAIAAAAAVLCLWLFGWRMALGFVAGAGVAGVNFVWLKGAVAALADSITAPGEGPRRCGKGIVVRFLLRYVGIAAGAYVILTVSPASLWGFLAGLFLPVAAIACEAVYEVYVALVRGV